MGKTALAVRWAHRARDDFAGHLYVNLRGHTGGAPMDPVEALAALLGGLGVDRIPAGPDEAAGLYRSLLSRERMLVLLDDARCAEQVRPLLPGGGDSLALVTSRYRLLGLVATEGAVAVPLDGLDPGSAESLLGRLLAPDPSCRSTVDSIGELARWCAGLPLALRIVAVNLLSRRPRSPSPSTCGIWPARTGSRPCTWTATATGACSPPSTRPTPRCPPPARCLAAQLAAAAENGLAPATLSTLAGLDGEQTRRALCELVDAHVARPTGPGHYALTDAWLRFGVHCRTPVDRAD